MSSRIDTAGRSLPKDQNRAKDYLDSWKEIASYLNRQVRTVQLWEKSEGLPVRRHLHRKIGSVYAYKSEIDQWRIKRCQEQSTQDFTQTTKLGSRAAKQRRLCFGPFTLELGSGELYRGTTRVKLAPQPCHILALLATHPRQVVTRDVIRDEIWARETFVDFDKSINFCIKQMRGALGDDARNPLYVETLPRRGYRFISEVKEAHAIGIDQISPSRSTSRKEEKQIRLAVLPFVGMGNHGDHLDIALGLTEAVITELGNLGLCTIVSTSAVRSSSSPNSARKIARELNVNKLVLGTIQCFRRRVRVTVHLVDTLDYENQWSESYDRDLGDLFSLQTQIAIEIGMGISNRLVGLVRFPFYASHFTNPIASEAYTKGRHYWNQRTERSVKLGMKYFGKAIANDALCGLAYAGLADSYIAMACWGYLPPKQSWAQVKAAALAGLQVNRGLGGLHASLAYARMFDEWNWKAAEHGFQNAMVLEPNNPTVHQWYADCLTALGRHREALNAIEHARALDPLSLILTSDVGWTYYHAGNYDSAIQQFDKALNINPQFVPALSGLAASHEQTSMFEAALREHQEAAVLSHNSPMMLAALGHSLAAAGKKTEANQILNRLLSLELRQYVPSYDVALIHYALGENSAADALMERAITEGSLNLLYANVDPRLRRFGVPMMPRLLEHMQLG